MKDVAFLITAYDQLREVLFTVKMLRTMWKSTKESPVVVVITGDKERVVSFPNDPYTRVVHLDDFIGENQEKCKVLVSTSIMRQIEHGMLEVKDLEREHGTIRDVVHMHGDILLFGEDGFRKTLDEFRASGRPVAADNVSPSNPISLDLFGEKYDLRFFGQELMPQLFVVDHVFCKNTGYMYNMSVVGKLEKKATEWALIGNLHRAIYEPGGGQALTPYIDVWSHVNGPYGPTFDLEVYCVKKNRQQWGVHNHWGGFAHFGNSIHSTAAERERKNKIALSQYGIDLEAW